MVARVRLSLNFLLPILLPKDTRLEFKTGKQESVLAIQRLTALWALNECGLGGILHAFNSAFTGLLVGSLAMVCIAFICSLAENKWKTIMTSMLVVLIIKALVSPHTPPTAYIAVMFQGITGALIYRYIPNLLIGSLLFFTLGLLESALQRLILLTILYGNTLWDAIDIWGKWVADRWNVILPASSSRLIIYVYLSVHFFVGILMGWLTFLTIKAVQSKWGHSAYQLQLTKDDRKEWVRKGGHKNPWKKNILLLAVILMIGLAYSQVVQGEHALQKALVTLLRVAGILVIWYVFLAPWVIRLIQRFLRKKHAQLADEVSHTMDMFPHLIWIVDKAWKETSGLSFFKKWKTFLVHSMLYLLQYKTADDLPVHGTDSKS